MAQNVGPILEMVTEKYLLRSEAEWRGRQEACRILDQVVEALRDGDVQRIGAVTTRNFTGPIQAIIPWVSNLYTERLIARVRAEYGERFWGFWMLGGMSGGGMGFIFDPVVRAAAQDRMQQIMSQAKAELESALPFAMEPVVYDFCHQRAGHVEHAAGRRADAPGGRGLPLMPAGYYAMVVPELVRLDRRQLPASRRAELNLFASAARTAPELGGMVQTLFDRLLPTPRTRRGRGGGPSLEALLAAHGFDPSSARTDPRGPAGRAAGPGAEPAAGQQ